MITARQFKATHAARFPREISNSCAHMAHSPGVHMSVLCKVRCIGPRQVIRPVSGDRLLPLLFCRWGPIVVTRQPAHRPHRAEMQRTKGETVMRLPIDTQHLNFIAVGIPEAVVDFDSKQSSS